jgi:hypothetical protein
VVQVDQRLTLIQTFSAIAHRCRLQRFALKPKPRKILKALLRNAFKIFLVVRLIDNCCKYETIRLW